MLSASTLPGVVLFAIPLLHSPSDLVAGQAFLRAAAETNVNQRYTVESVSVSGLRIESAKVPSRFKQRLNALIGERCDMTVIEQIAGDLRRELHLQDVTERLSKGSSPDRIRVNFDLVNREVAFDISVPRLLFHSKQGVSGELQASTHFRENTFTLGAVSNGDDLTERFTGVSFRYENSHLFSDRLRFRIKLEDYREGWADSTRRALATDSAPGLDLYRSRRNIAPEIFFSPARSVTISAGVSMERMRSEQPASGLLSANAATGGMHYSHKIEGDSVQQSVSAGYDVRIGLGALGSDYSYSRHMISARYEIKSGRQTAADEIMAGAISGDAPLFERFVLGTSSTLRGWDRYAIDPLGGTHALQNTVSYSRQFGERTAEVFYDSGSVWHTSHPMQFRHSVGVGYRQGVFVLTMAFPIVDGHVTPVFMAGMNY